MRTQLVEKLKLKQEAICSCYDEECKDVPDPAQCFLGNMPCESENLGIADGVCPELRACREPTP